MFFLPRLALSAIKASNVQLPSCNSHSSHVIARSLSLVSPSESVLMVENTKNGKKLLTMNRPKALNAMNLAMTQALLKELRTVNSNPSLCDLVILKGAGEKAFCAGGDVIAVTKSYREKTTIYKDFFRHEYQLNHLIGTLKVPFVALMGCGVSVNGRFRVATERTMLAMPETALGLFPDCGATYFLSQLPGKLGIFLGLTGHRLIGVDAYHSCLATHYVESSNLSALTQALLNLPSEKCNEASVEELLNGYHSGNQAAPFSLQPFLEEIDECFAAKSLQEVFDNLAKMRSEFAKAQLSLLHKMSPTSLKITFRQMNEGALLKFAEVFPIEYRIGQRCFEDLDFHEGCRAILIDKDHKPKWNPCSIEQVSDEKISQCFAPFENKSDELVIQ